MEEKDKNYSRSEMDIALLQAKLGFMKQLINVSVFVTGANMLGILFIILKILQQI